MNRLTCKYFSALLIVFYSCSFYAQVKEKNYSFIKKEFNRISYPADSSHFMRVFKKMDDIRSGAKETVRIAHIGGSHVQGGIWSNTFLTELQSGFSTTGGGYFVFPYRIAKTNQQPYASSFTNGSWRKCRAVGKEFCLPLGMSAMSVITNDSANSFGVSLTKKAVCDSFSLVKVYHNFNPSFSFNLQNIDSASFTRHEKKDEGYTLFRLKTPADSVVFNLIRKDTLQKDFILYGFSLENDLNAGFYLAGLGANGATSSSFLRCKDLVTQLKTIDIDLFILSLGVNDTQSKGFQKTDYIENYDSLITLLRTANPRAAILLTTTTDNYVRRKNSNKRTIPAREAMFQLMLSESVAVWDLFSLMGGYKSMPRWYKAGLGSRDKVHFTGAGYVLIGRYMYEAFMNSYRVNSKIK